MHNIIITFRPDGSAMCAEDEHGLLCFKTEAETHDQWMHRCSQKFHNSAINPEIVNTKK